VFALPVSLLAGLAWACVGDSPRPLVLGETRVGRIWPWAPPTAGRGPGVVLDWTPERDSIVTVTVESYDFEPFLRVEGDAGGPLENDPGGVAAWAVLSWCARARVAYRIEVISQASHGGDFLFALRSGPPPELPREEVGRRRLVHLSRAAARSVAFGETTRAYGLLITEGIIWRDLFQDHTRSTAAFRKALDIAEHPRDEAHALSHLGRTAYRRGELVLARDHWRRSARLFRDAGDEMREAEVLFDLGFVEKKCEELDAARKYFTRAAEIGRKLGFAPGEGRSLRRLGDVAAEEGSTVEAIAHYRRALLLLVGPEEGELRAIILNSLGSLLLREGEHDQALGCLEASAALFQELDNLPQTCLVLRNLAIACREAGNHRQALKVAQEHLQLAVACEEPAEEAAARETLGVALHLLGEGRRAREELEKSVTGLRDASDPDAFASALHNLGTVLDVEGDGRRALSCYREAEALYGQSGSTESQLLTMLNIGVVLFGFGELARARETFEEVLRKARAGGLHHQEEQAVANLGACAAVFQDHREAISLLQKSVEACRRRRNRSGEAETLLMLAAVHLDTGNHPRARALLEQARQTFTEARESGRVAETHGRLAAVRLAEGRYREAEDSARAQIDLARERGLRASLAEGLAHLARARYEQGDAEAAEGFARESTNLLAGLDREADSLDPLGTRALVAAGRGDAIGATRFLEEGTLNARKLVLRGAGPATTGLESLMRRMAVRSRYAEWALVSEDVTAAIARRDDPERESALDSGLRRAGLWKGRSLLEAAAHPLRTRPGVPGAAEEVPPDRLRRALGNDTALIEFVAGRKNLYAYVLTATTLQHVDLQDLQSITQTVRGLLELVENRETLANAATFAAAACSLYERVLAPCLEAAGGRRRLVIVPDPLLSGLPFEMLVRSRAPEGTEVSFRSLDYVLRDYTVAYAPSAPVLAWLDRERAGPVPERALILADPFYGVKSDERAEPFALRGGPVESLPRLPRSREEARVVAEHLVAGTEQEGAVRVVFRTQAQERHVACSGRWLDLFLGQEAHEGRLRTAASRYGLIQIMGHAETDEQVAFLSRLLLAPGHGDGALRLAEILDLDVKAALVVLSACQTHRGVVRRAEGVLSLAWGFLAAGARAVIASQWRVGDGMGKDLFERFYASYGSHLHPRLPVPDALRAAKLSLIENGSSPHPHTWAAFVCVGSAR